jgi:HK97 gp10 family phage protein
MASDQLKRLQKRLDAIPKEVIKAVQPALEKSGQELVATMKQLAEQSRESGELIESITYTTAGRTTPPYSQPGGEQVVPPNSVIVTAGNADVRYAHLVEFGTAPHNVAKGGGTVAGKVRAAFGGGTQHPGAPAKPFFWPSYRLLRRRMSNRIKRSISKAVREGWQK